MGVHSNRRFFKKFIEVLFSSLGIAFLFGCVLKQTYSGKVVDTYTGEPVVGAIVEVTYYEPGRFAPSLDGWYLRKPVTVSAVTDAQGHFSIKASRHHLDFWITGPPDSKSYRRSVEWWRVDESNPQNVLIRLKKSEERNGQ